MTLYDKINMLCKENKLTGKELGEKLGLKKSPLTDWKNQKSKPTIEQIIKICEIFAISADSLLFENNRDNVINEEEQKIITAYNNAAPAIKEAVKKLLDISDEKEKSSICKIG